MKLLTFVAFVSLGCSAANPTPIVATLARNDGITTRATGLRARKPSNPGPDGPLTLNYVINDLLNAVYTLEIELGTPPQKNLLVFDPSSGDLMVHSNSDAAFLGACQEQTPTSTCFGTFNNKSSSTFKDLSAGNAFNFSFGGTTNIGAYVSDTLHIGDSVVKGQTFALTSHGEVPISLFGACFPSGESGAMSGTFPRYPTVVQNLASQGQIESPSFSYYLSPSEGNQNGPDSFPDGSLIFGGLDESLIETNSPVATLPVVNGVNTSVAEDPLLWAVPLISAMLGNSSENLVTTQGGDPCVLDAGTAFNLYKEPTFDALVAALGSAAVLNPDTGVFEVPCSARTNPDYDITHVFADPLDPDNNRISLRQPASETIWTLDRILPGGDATKCALANLPFQEVLPAFTDVSQCVIGVNGLKSGYWMFDMDNREVTIARAAEKPGKSKIVGIPPSGVKSLNLGKPESAKPGKPVKPRCSGVPGHPHRRS